MQKLTESPSSQRRGRPPAARDDPPEEVRDRLAGLLPEAGIADAPKGLGSAEITGSGGLLSQLADRVIDAALRVS